MTDHVRDRVQGDINRPSPQPVTSAYVEVMVLLPKSEVTIQVERKSQ